MDHIKCKGKPVAGNLSLVAMNNDNTVGKLWPNQIIPVKESVWAVSGTKNNRSLSLSPKARTDAMWIGKAFINGWYMLGALMVTPTY